MSEAATVDLRPAAERRARRAWEEGAGAGLRAASAVYGLASDVRNFLYDTGLLAARRAPVPVVSVGGLSVGGSGKTPLAAELARWLAASGRRPAVVTHGFPDEMAVHRALNPEIPVVGDRDRRAAVVRAARDGADTAVLDSGFQHRRLERSCDVVVVGAVELGRGRRRLPAGLLRERWSALGRADAVVLVRRPEDPPEPGGFEGWLRRRVPWAVRARCLLAPGELVPANRAAREPPRAEPAVAVASVMHPATFFRSLEGRTGRRLRRYVLSDHRAPDRAVVRRIVADAGDDGVAGTRKDVVKLVDRLPAATPLWYLEERPVWRRGREELEAMIARTLDDAR